MRVHKVHVPGWPKIPVHYAATTAEAAEHKRSLLEQHGPELKRKDLEVAQVDIPAPKREHLAWLNAELVSATAKGFGTRG